MASGAGREPVKNYVELFERSVVNYVGGEVCFVISADRVDRPAELYETIRQSLNLNLTGCLHPSANGGTPSMRSARVRASETTGNSFAADLAVTDLADWSARLRTLSPDQRGTNPNGSVAQPDSATSIELLRPLDRRKAPIDPWVVLPRLGAPTTFLAFFALNSAVNPSDPRLVRQLVNCANLQLVGRDGPDAVAAGFRVVAATPNWLTIAAPNHGCGSPAGPPEAVPDARTPQTRRPLFHFGNASLEASAKAAVDVGGTVDGRVVVAILDTSPSTKGVQAAASPSDPRANWLMREVSETVHFDGALSLDPTYFDFLSGSGPAAVLPNLQGPEVEASGPPPSDAFDMADHGLFAAGIVRHLAPSAEVHLIRVLSNEGVGDMLAIIATLRMLPEQLQIGPNRKLVVNLSLGADIPVGERLLARWFPKSYADHTTLRQRWADMCRVTDPIDRGLSEVITALDEQGVVLVAAAGNDAFTLPTGRKDPRYPAHYENVLGVTATSRSGRLADYANLGDEAAFSDENGVATFGGNARLSGGPGSGPPRIDAASDPVDAIVGIFCAQSLPSLSGGSRTNQNGWVYWSGTSFATPIVSALVANAWRQNPSADHRQIVKDVLALAVPPAGPASAGYPDVPVIEVQPS